MTYEWSFSRADGTEVTVEYEVASWGSPGSYWEPPEGIQVELGKAYDTDTGAPITLTDAEAQAAEEAIYADPPEPDLGPDE